MWNTDDCLEAISEVCLYVNTEQTKYMVMSSHENAGQTHNFTDC
jgi:hypothetical protein